MSNAKIPKPSLELAQSTDLLVGVYKDPTDKRDYKYEAVRTQEELPDKVFLREYVGEIEDQLNTGSCVANATVSALELFASRANRNLDLSRLFVYWNVRAPYSYLRGKDEGSYLRDGFKSVNKFGVPDEIDWNFDPAKVNTEPPNWVYTKAIHNRALEYRRISKSDIHSIKDAIANGYPVIISTALGSKFMNLTGPVEQQSYEPVNSWNNNLVGYHAVTIVGYDNDLRSFIIENSWGTTWGDQGLGIYPYLCMIRDGIDVWVCTRFEYDDEEIEPEPMPTPEPGSESGSGSSDEGSKSGSGEYNLDQHFNIEEVATLKKVILLYKDLEHFFDNH
jgi:C1A family cysteine protease